MKPVIQFTNKLPILEHGFFRQFEDRVPVIVSVIGGLRSGKSQLIEAVFGIKMTHGARRHVGDVYAAIKHTSQPNLLILEWETELNRLSLAEDVHVLHAAAHLSDIVILMPYTLPSVIDETGFMRQFLAPSEAIYVFSSCSDIDDINDRAKIALTKKPRVCAMPPKDNQDFEKKVLSIQEAVSLELSNVKQRSLTDYHKALDQLSVVSRRECDFSQEINEFLERQCFYTLKQIAQAAFKSNIRPKLPMEEDELIFEKTRCLEELVVCGKAIVRHPSTTFFSDVRDKLAPVFNEWQTINSDLSYDACQNAYLEFKKKKAAHPSLSSATVKLVGPAKKEFGIKLAEFEAMSTTVVNRKRKLDASQEGSVKRQRVAAEGPLKKGITFNDAKLDKNSPPEVQRMNRDLTALKLFRNVFFRNALGETPFYRLTNANQKIIVCMPLKKSFLEYVDSHRIDPESGEKIQFDQATRKKIDEALLSAKQRGLIPTSTLQEVVNAAFGYKAKSTNSKGLLNAMANEEDITFHFKLLDVTVNNQPCKFNKFTVKAKTRMTVIKHIVAYFKVLTTTTEKEKQQEIFDAFRESCFGEQADLVKNEFFELFFDTMDHTTIDIPDDPTEEEHSVHLSHEQPMDVSEDVVAKSPCLNFNLPVDAMMEDEALLTTGSHEEEEEEFCPSSQYSLADNIICLDDDD